VLLKTSLYVFCMCLNYILVQRTESIHFKHLFLSATIFFCILLLITLRLHSGSRLSTLSSIYLKGFHMSVPLLIMNTFINLHMLYKHWVGSKSLSCERQRVEAMLLILGCILVAENNTSVLHLSTQKIPRCFPNQGRQRAC